MGAESRENCCESAHESFYENILPFHLTFL